MPPTGTRFREGDAGQGFISQETCTEHFFLADGQFRQREGIDAALAKGVQFGRPRKEHEAFEYAAGLYRQKKIPLEEALEMCDMSRSTFYRHLRGISTKESQKVHFMRLAQNMESDPEKNSERTISPLRN